VDEKQLLTGLKSRDPEAIRYLVATYGQRLLRSAWLLCGNETEAQDIVQDTLVEAMRCLGQFQGRSTVYTWLQGILLNLVRHYHRDRQKLLYDNDATPRELWAAEETPMQMDLEVAASALRTALARLAPAHREVILLRYFEHMKIRDIASQLRISSGTVKSRLHYAIAELQRLLPRQMNLFGACVTERMDKR
jgi:RNA polymerase sigma-70 factor (ECF subfamily)